MRGSQTRRSILPIAAVLALLATIALAPQCSLSAPCCRTEITAGLHHPCCPVPRLNNVSHRVEIAPQPSTPVVIPQIESVTLDWRQPHPQPTAYAMTVPTGTVQLRI
jgi:hypothetical protein